MINVALDDSGSEFVVCEDRALLIGLDIRGENEALPLVVTRDYSVREVRHRR